MPHKTVNRAMTARARVHGSRLSLRGCAGVRPTPTQLRRALPFDPSELNGVTVLSKCTAVAKCLENHRKVFFVYKKQLSATLFPQKQLFVQQKILSAAFSGVYAPI